MKNQCANEKIRRLLAFLTALAIISGVLAVFPALAASYTVIPQSGSSAPQSATTVLSNNDTTTGKAYPGYVVFDAEYINANLIEGSGRGAENGGIVGEGAEKAVRLNAVDLEGKKHNDPFITLNMRNVYSADAYGYITLIVRADKVERAAEKSGFEIFFDTDSDTPNGYNESKKIVQPYAAVDGYQALVYDFSNHAQWKGKISNFRLDFYTGSELGDGDYCDIAAIILSKTPDYVYESAYDFFKTVYAPKQVLKDFGEDSLKCFTGNLSATKASISNGNLLLTSSPKGDGTYNDPWADFLYKDYMKSAGRENEILKTSEFSHTVIKFRTSDNIPALNEQDKTTMQLFVYTNQERFPVGISQVDNRYGGFLSPSHAYTPSQDYNWQTAIYNMDCAQLVDNPLTTSTAGDAVSRWTYTENFNGFRIDWCHNGAEGAFLEMDEMMFFESGEDATYFSRAVNTIKMPLTYPTDYTDDGEKYIPSVEVDGCIGLDAYGIDEMLDCSEGVTSTTFASDEGWTGIRLSALADAEDPCVILKTNNLKMDMYSNLTFIIRRNGIAADKQVSLAVHYKTENMADYDSKHVAKASYKNTDSWQIISMDMSDMPDLIYDVTELKLEFLADADSFAEGAGCEIFAIATCESNAKAMEFAKWVLLNMYTPKQVIGGLSMGDEGYFASNGKIDVSGSETGGVRLTVEEDATDPSVDIFYSRFMLDSDKYKALTTDEFSCAVLGVNAFTSSGVGELQLSMLGSNRQATHADVKSDKVSYKSGLAQPVVFDMLGGENADGWFGSVDYLRLTLNGEVKAGDTLEISDIILFKDSVTAEKYCNALATFDITECEAPDDEPEETLPEISAESETRPNFDDTEETEDSEEIEETESETELPSDSEETTSPDEESSSDDTESESEDEKEESNNAPFAPPTDFDPNAGSPEGEQQRGEGSKTPFVVACISLTGLSGASIVSVIVIRLKLKIIV